MKGENFTKGSSKCLSCEHCMKQTQVATDSQPHAIGKITMTNESFLCTKIMNGFLPTTQEENGDWIPNIIECDKYSEKKIKLWE